MKPKNFPGRKYQRQQAVIARANGKPTKAGDIEIPTSIRAVRTKKARG